VNAHGLQCRKGSIHLRSPNASQRVRRWIRRRCAASRWEQRRAHRSRSEMSSAFHPRVRISARWVTTIAEAHSSGPARTMCGGAGLTIALVTQIPILFALSLGGLMFGVLFTIYNDDPRALQAWQRSIGRPVRWSAPPQAQRSVAVLPSKE